MQETGFNPWVRKIPWRRKSQFTPVFLPGESHGQRSLVGYISPWGRRVGHDSATSLYFKALPHHSQNKGLSEYQRRVSRLRTSPSPTGGREAGGWQPEPARGNLGPRDGILYQTASRLPVANQAFLGSWTVDIHQEGRSQRSEETHGTPETALLL